MRTTNEGRLAGQRGGAALGELVTAVRQSRNIAEGEAGRPAEDDLSRAFWSLAGEEAARQLQTGPEGLSGVEAAHRLRLYGANLARSRRSPAALKLLLSQFRSPMILILLGAALLSFFLREPVDASIIVAIVLLSGLLGFWQEKRAAGAVEMLLALVRLDAQVLRDGVAVDVPVEEVVPGDVCLLDAGDCSPATASSSMRKTCTWTRPP